MLRIAIDARKALDGGIGRHLREIVRRLPEHFPGARLVLFVAPGTEAAVAEAGLASPRFEIVPEGARKYGIRELLVFRSRLRDLRADLFHSPHYVLPFDLPCPSVVTVHDVIHLDDRHRPLHRAYARCMLGRAVHRASAVITVSEHSAVELVTRLGASRDRIQVIANGVACPEAAARQRAARGHAEPPYLLCIGSLKEHKNVGGLIRAFALAAPRLPEHVLRLHGQWIGEAGQRRRLAQLARELGVAERVLFLGEVPESGLKRLYAQAACLVAPAFEEGFGLTPLEAMAWGAPVVASMAAAHCEVLGEAALYADCADARALADVLVRAVEDEAGRQARVSAGLDRAASLSWDRAAAATAAVYRRLLQ